MRHSHFTNIASVEAMRFSGGLWCFWDASSVGVHILSYTSQLMNIGIMHRNAVDQIISLVYASPTLSIRETFYEYVESMYDHITTPWLLLGDFNQVVRQEDNRGARAVWDYGAKRMLCMIDKCKLIDVEFSGPRFTWTNGQLGHLLIEQQRLDQGWANEAWHDRFHSSALHHLP